MHFFHNDPSPAAFSTLSLHDALPICEDIGWSSRDANVLRRVGVARAGIDADAGEDFDIVAIHQVHAASGSNADKLGKVLGDRKSTRLNSSHRCISYAVFCLKKKKT